MTPVIGWPAGNPVTRAILECLARKQMIVGFGLADSFGPHVTRHQRQSPRGDLPAGTLVQVVPGTPSPVIRASFT
ncbi:hypothetical protein E2C01_024407 [Portunus trituberculatus]|uniref:Uncharacterized protein n=1 Tax=Portunus trituberculatus TaxID=210409 RepID=A0A5B7EC85_PORTR|nr:hypothetical protein [Portunus trituberculatus]